MVGRIDGSSAANEAEMDSRPFVWALLGVGHGR